MIDEPAALTAGQTGAALEGLLQPAWSPDGELVTFTGPVYRGIYVVPAAGGALQELAAPERVSGYRHRWSAAGGRILCPARGAHPAVEIEPAAGTIREVNHHDPTLFVRRDDLYVRTDDGEVRLTQGEDRFFDPRLSPDGTVAAVVGLATGIHVIDVATGRALYHAGPGTHPVFTPDGAWLLYERTEDDGQRLTGSDLMALSMATGATRTLTETADAIERHPAPSPDGSRLAFIRDGVVWTARLREVSP